MVTFFLITRPKILYLVTGTAKSTIRISGITHSHFFLKNSLIFSPKLTLETTALACASFLASSTANKVSPSLATISSTAFWVWASSIFASGSSVSGGTESSASGSAFSVCVTLSSGFTSGISSAISSGTFSSTFESDLLSLASWSFGKVGAVTGALGLLESPAKVVPFKLWFKDS